MDYAEMQRQQHQAKLGAINTRARQEHDAMHVGLNPYQEQLAHNLVKFQSLPRAAKATGVSRESVLDSFRDPKFCSRVEELYHAEISKALEVARYERDRAEMVSNKSSEIRSLINRLSKNITYCLEKAHYRVDDIFPELKVLL